MMTALLIVHGLLAVLLLGALTHQALVVLWPRRRAPGGQSPGGRSFVDRLRAVSGSTYTGIIVGLFIVTFAIGAIIYPAYRLNVRTYLQDYRMLAAEGAFEVKEHLAAIGLALLPLYWLLWRNTPTGDGAALVRSHGIARTAVTTMLALAVWSSFLIGHILNNIRGLFGT